MLLTFRCQRASQFRLLQHWARPGYALHQKPSKVKRLIDHNVEDGRRQEVINIIASVRFAGNICQISFVNPQFATPKFTETHQISVL